VTIPEFLKASKFTKQEIADSTGVDVCQVYRWQKGQSVPEGPALVRLFLIADGDIGIDELPMGSSRGRHKKGAA
jgi:transcriptional regulator with XRE-family HTH domain